MAVPLTCPNVGTLERLVLGQLPPDEIANLQEHLAHCPECLKNLNDLPTDDPLLQAMRSLPAAGPEEEAVERLMERLRCVGPSSDTVWMDTVARNAAAADTPGERSPESYDFLTGKASSGELGWLGDYRVLRVLGSGGMGTVFEAEDSLLQRPVALKLMRPSMACHPEAKQRFLREARAAAAIQHDHIVTIHQVGEDRGIPYLAMQLLHGETLERRLRQCGRLPALDVVRIGREVARGLAAAHARGLIHRDIKPSNIWLEVKPEGGSIAQEQDAGTNDESGMHADPAPQPLSFRVKILDFGLARAAAETAQTTQSSLIAGTPAYMAPEQASDGPIDHRCDLFGLGCVLYRACTGELPFKGVKPLTILWSLAVTEPPPPRKLHADVPRALSDLIEKLLAKNPADRPQSAREVADALRAIEADLARPARPVPQPRRRVALVATVALMALLTTVAYLYGAAVYRLVTNQGVVVVETDDPDVKVVVKQDEQQVTILDAKTNQEVTLKAGRYQVELSPQKEGLRLSAKEFTLARGDKQIVRVRMEAPPTTFPEIRSFVGHSGAVWGVAVTPDGRRVLSAGYADAVVRVWDKETGKQVRLFQGHAQPVLCVTCSPTEDLALTGSEDSSARLWDIRTGAEVGRLEGHEVNVWCAAFTSDGSRVLTGSFDTTMRLWDVKTRQTLRKFRHPNCVSCLAVSPDDHHALSGGWDGMIRLWDLQTGEALQQFRGHDDYVLGLAYFPDRRRAISCGRDGRLRLWDITTTQMLREFKGHTEGTRPGIAGLSLSRDGRRVVTAGYDRTVRLWDVESGSELGRGLGHTAEAQCVALTPDGRHAVSGGRPPDNTIRLWKLPQGQPSVPTERPVHTLSNQDSMSCVQFCLHGTHVISAGGYRYENGKWTAGPDFALRLWDANYGQPVAKLEGHTGAVMCLAVSPDGKRAVSSSVRGDDVRLWDLENRKLSHHLQGHTKEVHTLAFSADGRLVVSSSDDQSVRLWDVQSGNEVGRIDVGGTERVWGMDTSGNGKRIVTVSRGSAEIQNWDAETGKRIEVLQFPGGVPTSFAFSADGRFGLALISDGNGASEKLVLWDLRTNTIIQTFQPPRGGIGGRLAIAADGRHILTGGEDATVRLWDAATGNELHRYEGHKGPVNQVAFSPDGRLAASASSDKTVRIWKLPPPGPVHTLVGHNDNVWQAKFCLGGTHVISAGGNREENKRWVIGSDFELRLWNVRTGHEVQRFGDHKQIVRGLAVSPDGKRVVSAGGENAQAEPDWDLRLWDLETGKLIRRFEGHTAPVFTVAYSADGKHIVSASGDRSVRLWDVETGAEIRRFKEGETAGDWVADISRDGTRILSAADGKLRLWNAQTGEFLRSFKAYSGGAAIQLSPDGRLALTQRHRGIMELWDLETDKSIRQFRHEDGWALHYAFSPDGTRFLSGGQDGTVRLWDIATGKELRRFETGRGIATAAFSPDGRFAVSAGWDHHVKIWKLPPPEPVHTLVGHNDIVWGARFCLDGTHVVSAGGTRWEQDTKRWLDGSDFQLRLWNVRTGQEIRRFGDHTQSVGYLAVSPDGKRVISSGGRTDNSMRLWDLQTGQLIRRYDKHSGVVGVVSFSPDGKRFASSSFDKSLRLWDVETGQEIHCFEEGKTVFRAVDFSRDGKYVLSGSDDSRLRLWNADTGEIVHSLDGAYKQWGLVNLSPDGRFALSNGLTPEGRSCAELWDLEKKAPVRQFRHELGWVTQSSGLSPDGKRFLSCGQDGTLRLWEIATGKELCRFETPPSSATANAIATAAFSPDGRFAVAAGWDHNVRIWKLPE